MTHHTKIQTLPLVFHISEAHKPGCAKPLRWPPWRILRLTDIEARTEAKSQLYWCADPATNQRRYGDARFGITAWILPGRRSN